MPESGNIYLIGYRCTGKTTTGKRLAELRALCFLDTDEVFVERWGFSVAEFVAMNGWNSFRRLESEILTEAAQKSRLVVATGGGAVLLPENVTRMKESGRVFWLQASWEVIYRRLNDDPASSQLRPGLTDMSPADEIRETLAEREPYYREAMDAAVDTDALSVEEVCEKIMKLSGPEN